MPIDYEGKALIVQRIFYECSDRDIPAGGVRRLYRHVEVLCKHGYDAAILHHRVGFRLTWLSSPAAIRYWDELDSLSKDDFLVIPEGHSRIMLNTIALPCQRIVIALNWSRIFGALPIGTTWQQMGINDIIAGSLYEHDFIRATMGLESTVIASGIDSMMFAPSLKKQCQIAYMPQKNPHYFHMIAASFRARFRKHMDVPFVPISGIKHSEVALILAKSAIFLAHTFPEGLSRKTLEAMACECIVVGHAGHGSLECMNHMENCYLAADGDVLQVIQLLNESIHSFQSNSCRPMRANARNTAALYSLEREEEAILSFWRQRTCRGM